MPDSYSLYEAKARLSEILRRVREGRTVTISYRGEPVAEVRPVPPQAGDIEARLQELAGRGQYRPAGRPFPAAVPVVKRPGGLERFARDRSRY